MDPLLEPQVRVLSLAAAWSTAPDLAKRIGTIVSAPERHAFTQLNTAFMPDGAVVHVGRDASLRRPIHLVFVSDTNAAKTVMYPRTLIVVERGARASVIESYVSLGDAMYFTNVVTEVSVADGATLEHYKLQRESRRAFHVGTIVRSAHEHWDGRGYPDGLAGEKIPLGARIVCACDAFHAITSERPYSAARSVEEAIGELRANAATQFDPRVVKALIAELRKAADRVQGREQHTSRNSGLLLIGIVLGILFNPLTGASTRKWLSDRLLGGTTP